MPILPYLLDKGLYFDKPLAINLAPLKKGIEPMHEPFRQVVLAKGLHEELQLLCIYKAILIKVKLS